MKISNVESSSHANVHSQERPHFCPVEGCPRGVGGKGFKRKNEMMRHGLVHNSPGYVCPFCPDQQHRYPRPDNLQRYVNPSIHPSTKAQLIPADMSESTMSTKIKTTRCSGRSSPNAPPAAQEADGGDSIPDNIVTSQFLNSHLISEPRPHQQSNCSLTPSRLTRDESLVIIMIPLQFFDDTTCPGPTLRS